jgi:tight adherence protein C
MAARVGREDVRLLASSIVQAETLGTSLVTTMQNQARLIRVSRRRQAEAHAMRAPVKMVFPMVAFILPVLFLVVLGPPGLQLSQALSRGHP